MWLFELSISAADLGATSGSLSFVFGADDRVQLFVGNGGTEQDWGSLSPLQEGSNPLGCSANGGPTSAGSSNPYSCLTSVTFDAANLNGDGSLTLFAYDDNDPIGGCPACGDPSGFVLAGTLSPGGSLTSVPEPLTLSLFGAGLAGAVAMRRRKKVSA